MLVCASSPLQFAHDQLVEQGKLVYKLLRLRPLPMYGNCLVCSGWLPSACADYNLCHLRKVYLSSIVGSDIFSLCRCLVVCKSLGIFATAHADGKLYLRALPELEGGGGPTATIGEHPVQTLSDAPAAIIQV